MKPVVVVLVAIFFIGFSISCNRGPYATTNKAYKEQAKQYAKQLQQTPPAHSLHNASFWAGTTNFNLRKPNIVVIHHTAQNSCDQTLKTFITPKTAVSAHYVICKDGTVHHMLNDYLRSWHSGSGKWGNITDVNSSSIGIELDNNGFEKFTDQQLQNLVVLLDTLKRRYNIPAANFIAHADMAPTRKVDPNIYFPWKMLADKGFGQWWSDTTGVTVPEYFNNIQALRIIGYDVKDTTAAIGAFSRKFLQQEKKSFDDAGRKILYSIYLKSL